MSTRNIRKIFGGNSLPSPESDDDYEPRFAKESPSKFKFQGLVLSSHSESEQEATEETNNTVEKKTKKKRKKKKQRQVSSGSAISAPQQVNPDLDEIDKVVSEVNALLGSPAALSKEENQEAKPVANHMMLSYKHLNVAYEEQKFQDNVNRRGRDQNFQLKKYIVAVNEAFFMGNRGLGHRGLSMSLQRTENDCMYFTFNHSKEYQNMHSAFLRSLHHTELNFEAARSNRHIEAMLQAADSIYLMDAHQLANTTVEQVIAVMEQAAHPSFNLTNPKVRLEYKYPENRPFHIALFKYMYTLTNKARHRTALELARLLLNLDPSDPLAVFLIIDTLALRAREHQWLIDAFDRWDMERDAGFLYNMRYSYALAHYHVAVKKKEEVSMSKADEVVRDALMRFPLVAVNILQFASMPLNSECPLFKDAEKTSSKPLKELITLYAKLSLSWWREPGAIEWLTSSIDRLATEYTTNTDVQERCKYLENERGDLYRSWPYQIVRHLTIIKPMVGLLFNGDITLERVGRSQLAFDPLPPRDSVHRYDYNNALNNAINFAELFATRLI